MSERTYYMGMDDAANGAPPRTGRFASDPDYTAGYDDTIGTSADERHYPEPSMPEPSDEDLCGSFGHKYYGEDPEGPRCYCGHRREFSPIEIPSPSDVSPERP